MSNKDMKLFWVLKKGVRAASSSYLTFTMKKKILTQENNFGENDRHISPFLEKATFNNATSWIIPTNCAAAR